MLPPCNQDSRIITTRPFAFSAPEYVSVSSGMTVAEIVRDIHEKAGVPASWCSSALVMINGEVITPDRWTNLVPAAGANVVVSTSLHGGGGGKNPLRTLLTIVVMVVATYVTGGGAATAGGWFAAGSASASVAGAAITIGGMMLVNAIAPIRPPALQGSASASAAESPTYSLSGGQNDIRRFGVVPVVLGTHKHTPPLGAMSYTEILGNDEYLRMLVVWGYGPLQIKDLKIGETPITNFSDVEIQTVEGWSTDPDITLFPRDVYQDQVGTDLTYSAGWVQRTSQPNASVLSVDIVFPRGLTVINDAGQRIARTVEFELRYRKVGDVTWIDVPRTVTKTVQTVSGWDFITSPFFHYGIYIDDYSGIASYAQGTGAIAGKILVGEVYLEYIKTGLYDGEWYPRIINYSAPEVTGFTCTLLSSSSVSVSAGTLSVGMLSTRRATAQAVRVGRKWNVDDGYQYEVAIRRTTADSTDDRTIDSCVWTILRTFQMGHPTDFRQPLAMTALRIKATEQLSGAISNLNATVTSYANVWDGSNWDTILPTNNPAALMRLVLMGPANERRRTAAQVDQDSLAEFYDFCDENGYAFNMVRDFVASVWSTCADIAAAGRASVTLPNGKWGVVMDVADRPIRQHLTPRNSWGFESTKQLSIRPHAWRVRFVNEDQDYKQDERIVYDDGYTVNNATQFEGIEFPGVTDPDLIWKFGRFHLAQLRLRPEEYSLTCGMEHLACQRGDVILVGHDITMWGLGWGRVKELTLDGANITGIVVDEEFVMEAGKTYNVRFRLDEGTSYVREVTTVVGANTTLVFSEPTTTNIQVGDLALFGETGTETQRLLVKGMSRGDNYSANLVLVDESPDIYTADTGTIPEHVTNISNPTNITEIPPAVPLVVGINSGTSALVLIGSTLVSRIMVSLVPGGGNIRAVDFQVRYRENGNLEWQFFTAPAEEGTIAIWPVQDNTIYELQARAANAYGFWSDWSISYLHTVIGQSELPPDVTGFSVIVNGDQAHISWEGVDAIDLSHYEIRWSPETSGATWNSAIAVDPHVAGTSTALPAQVGTYLIKAVDRAGNKSETATAAITNIAKLNGFNAIITLSETDPTWLGTMNQVAQSTHFSGLALEGMYPNETFVLSDALIYATSGSDAFEVLKEGLIDTQPLYSEGWYTMADQVDLGAVFTSRVYASLAVTGADLNADLYDYDDLYDPGDLYGADDDEFGVEFQLRITNDDPAATPTWSEWHKLIVGDYSARAFEFRVYLTGDGNAVTPIITMLQVQVDMPDRVLRFIKDVASGGSRVSFSPAFYAFPDDKGLGISVIDGQEGDAYTITNLDETGFDIAFTNGGSPVARRISGIAQSYGEVIV